MAFPPEADAYFGSLENFNVSPPLTPLLSFPASLPLPPSLSLSLGLGVVCKRQTGVNDLRSHGSGSVHTLELKEEFRQREEVEQARHSGVTVWSCSEAFSHLFIRVQTHASRDLGRLHAELCDPGRMFGTAVETPGFCSLIFSFFCFSFSLLPVGCLKEPRPLRDVRECEEQFCAPVKFPEVSEVCMWWLVKGENEGAGPAQGLMVCLG